MKLFNVLVDFVAAIVNSYSSKDEINKLDFFKPKKEKELFNIHESITTAYSLIKPMLNRNNIIFRIDVNSNLGCFGFKNEFAQVILSILNN